MFNRVHTEPVATIDQGRSPLRLLDEMPKKMWLRVIKSFDTALGYNAAAIGLACFFSSWGRSEVSDGSAYGHD